MTNVSPDALWSPIVEHGCGWCAPNIHATASWLDTPSGRWRVAVTSPVNRNCYVVSATGQYLDYAREEVRRIASPLHRGLSHFGFVPLSPMLRALDPITVLDALPVSTVLHATRTKHDWAEALECARRAYPGRPVVVRSLDAVTTAETIAQLIECGLQLVPSRMVFHQDPREKSFWRIRNIRHDMTLADTAPLASRRMLAADAPRIAELYWQLYGEKHSTLNPQFSVAWLAHGISAGVLRGEGLIHNGRLAAAYLSYTVNDIMTNPVFGYDLTIPQSVGLYRRLSLRALQDARDTGLVLHASSGAPGFKQSRGGVPALEYHAVDLRGVRGAQRAAWRAMIWTANAIGPQMLRNAQ